MKAHLRHKLPLLLFLFGVATIFPSATNAIVYGPITFRGPSIDFGTFVDPSPDLIVAPPPGITVTGSLNFEANASTVVINFGVIRPLSILIPVPAFETTIQIDGDFASLSANTTARLVNFRGITDVLDASEVNVIPGSAVTALAVPPPIPLSTNVLNVIAQDTSNLFGLPVGNYVLRQTVDIVIGGLAVGEMVEIHLPTTSTIEAVPEPSTFILLLAGILGTTVIGWRRRKKTA